MFVTSDKITPLAESIPAKDWEALDEFPGSLLLVTHEDDFYDGLVDIKLEFE